MPFDILQLINPLPVDMSDAYTSGDIIVERFKDKLDGKTSKSPTPSSLLIINISQFS